MHYPTFSPTGLLANPHLQTIVPHLFRRSPFRYHRRQRLELTDGDFLDVDRLDHPTARGTAVIFHGLGGNSRAPYVMGLAGALLEAGFNVAAVNFRGCSGEANRLPRSYHCAASDDALQALQALDDGRPMVAVGFSLGGNVVGRLLGGAEGGTGPLVAGATVSAPFDLHATIQCLDRGLARGYQQFLLLQLKRQVWPRRRQLSDHIDMQAAMRASNFREFDDRFTAPLHGFRDAHDYWTRASAQPLLKNVALPTLVIHAADDPFMPPTVVPPADALSPSITVLMQPSGGHVGFMGASNDSERWWLDSTLARWFAAQVPAAG